MKATKWTGREARRKRTEKGRVRVAYLAFEYGSYECDCEHCKSRLAGDLICSATSFNLLLQRLEKMVEEFEYNQNPQPVNYFGDYDELGAVIGSDVHGIIMIERYNGMSIKEALKKA